MPMSHNRLSPVCLAACCLFTTIGSGRGEPATAIQPTIEQRKDQLIHRDLVFAKVGDLPLKLDLYIPKNTDHRPHAVVFFHGGSWRAGSKSTCQLQWLTRHGYAVASVGYRLSQVAKFPAIMHDCKGAVRFLRANAGKLGINAGKMGAAGCSAGGHLALVLATSGGVEKLEGDVGGNLDQSSRVQAAIGMYCPTDLFHDASSAPERWDNPGSPIYQFLGAKPSENLALAKLASATAHVSKDDPPLILLAGGADKPGPTVHGKLLQAAYDKAGLNLTFQVLEGAGHGGPQYRDKERTRLIVDLLDEQLIKKGSSK